MSKRGRPLLGPGSEGPMYTSIRMAGHRRTVHVVSEQERGTWEKHSGNSRKLYIKADGEHGRYGDEQVIQEAIGSSGYEVR